MYPTVKPGWQTTEFWTLVVIVGLTFARQLGWIGDGEVTNVDAIAAWLAAGATGAAYILGRAKVKAGPPR